MKLLKTILPLFVLFVSIFAQNTDLPKWCTKRAPEELKIPFKINPESMVLPVALTLASNINYHIGSKLGSKTAAPGPTTAGVVAAAPTQLTLQPQPALPLTAGPSNPWTYQPQAGPSGLAWTVLDDPMPANKFDWVFAKKFGACNRGSIWLSNATTDNAPLIDDCDKLIGQFAVKGNVNGMNCFHAYKYKYRSCMLKIQCRHHDPFRNAVVADIDLIYLMDQALKQTRSKDHVGTEGAIRCRDTTGKNAMMEFSVWKPHSKISHAKNKNKNKQGRDLEDLEFTDHYWDERDSDVTIFDE